MMNESICNNEEQNKSEEDMQQDVVFIIEDESGVEHRLKLLTIFTAGKLNHQYVAGITTDIMLYRYSPKMQGMSDYKIYIEEIMDDEEFEEVVNIWNSIFEAGISEKDLREETVYMEVTEAGEVYEYSLQGTVFKIFEINLENKQQYIAICPHNIMFFRYNLNETEGQESVEISQIYSPQEYDDVVEHFNSLIISEEESV